MVKYTFASVIIIFISGCATTLKSGAERFKIAEGSPPAGCAKVDSPLTMDAYDLFGSTDQEKSRIRETVFRNAAYDKGGNYVEVEKVSEHRYLGTFFRCP